VKKQESAKEEFEMITEILRKELDRFEKTKGREIAKALKDYAKENMDTTVQVWTLPPQVCIAHSDPHRSWINGRSSLINSNPFRLPFHAYLGPSPFVK